MTDSQVSPQQKPYNFGFVDEENLREYVSSSHPLSDEVFFEHVLLTYKVVFL